MWLWRVSSPRPGGYTWLIRCLNSQLARGVSGFRVDAAKHIPAADLEAIAGRLDDTADGARPFVFHEVFPGGTPAPGEYYRQRPGAGLLLR